MAIRIPIHERKILSTPAQVAPTRVNPAAAPDTASQAAQGTGKAISNFGNQMESSLRGLGDQINQFGGQLVKEQRMEDERLLLAAHTEFRMNKNSMLSNAETDKDGRPKGLMNRQLEHANGATKEYDESYLAMREQFLSKFADNPRAQKALAARMDSDYVSDRDNIQRHESGQRQKAYEVALDSNLKQRTADAARIVDPEALAEAIEEATFIQSDADAKLGLPDEAAGVRRQELISKIASTSILANLENDPRAGAAKLDRIKDMLDPDDAAKLGQAVEGAMLEVEQAELWDSVRGQGKYRLAGGAYNDAALKELAFSQEGTIQTKEKMYDYLRKEATAEEHNLREQRAAQQRLFERDAIKAKSNGVPYAQARKALIKKYGWDSVDKSEKENQLSKLFGGQEAPFYEQVAKSWTHEQKLAWDQIEAIAAAKYPKGKSGKKRLHPLLPGEEVDVDLHQEFLTQMRKEVATMPASQMLEHAQKRLEKSVVQKKKWWFDKKAESWRTGAAKDRTRLKDMEQLESNPTYGPLIEPMRAKLKKAGIDDPSPEELRSILNDFLSKQRKK